MNSERALIEESGNLLSEVHNLQVWLLTSPQIYPSFLIFFPAYYYKASEKMNHWSICYYLLFPTGEGMQLKKPIDATQAKQCNVNADIFDFAGASHFPRVSSAVYASKIKREWFSSFISVAFSYINKKGENACGKTILSIVGDGWGVYEQFYSNTIRKFDHHLLSLVFIYFLITMESLKNLGHRPSVTLIFFFFLDNSQEVRYLPHVLWDGGTHYTCLWVAQEYK